MSSLWMFPSLIAGILTGFPVSFVMLVLAVAFGWWTFGPIGTLHQAVLKVEEVATSTVLAAVPLFIFMGAMFEASGIASRLFDAIHMWTRRIPGGLAIGTVIMCVIFAATSGIVGATETVVGLLATGYIVYIFFRCVLRPEDGPRIAETEPAPPIGERIAVTMKVLVPPVIVIICVLGSMMAGIATPTEASATGALGTVLLAASYGRLTWPVVVSSTMRTVRITAMILFIVTCGSIFAAVFVGSGGLQALTEVIEAVNLGRWGLFAIVMFIVFLAGFMLDPLVIILMVVPIATPLVVAAGFDKVWFCVVFLVMLQTAYLTPPMAPSIFYLRGIAPPEITLNQMYRGIWPFIGIQVVVVTLIIVYPDLVTWLPTKLTAR